MPISNSPSYSANQQARGNIGLIDSLWYPVAEDGSGSRSEMPLAVASPHFLLVLNSVLIESWIVAALETGQCFDSWGKCVSVCWSLQGLGEFFL